MRKRCLVLSLTSLDSTPTLMVKKWQFTMATNHWLLYWRTLLQIVLWDSSKCSAESWDDFEIKFVKGKDLLIADALSRSQTTSQNRCKFEHEIEATWVVHEDQSVTSSLAEIAEATAHDTELQSVHIVHHISKGWTNTKRNVPLKFDLLEHQGRTVGQCLYCLQERSHRSSGGPQEDTHCQTTSRAYGYRINP